MTPPTPAAEDTAPERGWTQRPRPAPEPAVRLCVVLEPGTGKYLGKAWLVQGQPERDEEEQ